MAFAKSVWRCVAGCLLLVSPVLLPAAAPADAIFLGGKIITLDAHERVAAAIAVCDGRIAAVGTDEEIARLAGAQTQVVRLGGRTVVPGFIETHCHSIGVARASLIETYTELSSIAEIQDWIRRRAGEVAPGTWIEVPRNEITRLRERRHPTPAELDAATTNHPVVYTSVMKHVLNTPGWRALGVLAPDSKLADGEVVRDERGAPLLIRGGGSQSLRKLNPPRAADPDATVTALKTVLRRYNEVGITTLFERATDREGFALFRGLRDRGELTARMRATFRFSARTAEGVEKYVKSLGLKPGEGDDWVKAGPLKITVDGGIHWGTTRLSEPYGPRRAGFYRLVNPEYQGELLYSVAEMKTVFGAVERLGWPMSCHVTGDGGTESVLEAVAAVAVEQPGIKERRFNLIHSYFPSPAIVRRAKELGVGVDTQGYLYYRDAGALADIYGRSWAERFIGLAEWVRGGVPVSINSDHMIGLDPDHAMNAFNPALMLWIAVARQSDDGKVYGAHQKLSRLDALRSVTKWAAWLSFDEDRLGTIEAGKLADFVVLDRDYLSCPEPEIRRIKPVRTVVAGRTVFQR